MCATSYMIRGLIIKAVYCRETPFDDLLVTSCSHHFPPDKKLI